MKATCRALALAALIAPAAFATKVPIPIEGATLNISVQIQSQFLVTQAGAPDGTTPAYDFNMRRTRLLVNGDMNQNFSYLFQIDNANFAKFGNFTPRAIIQDAWVGWAPGGITGGTVIYIDAGLLLIPISHHLLESTTNFVTADVITDDFRFTGNVWPGLRDTGVQLRGWLWEKRIGFRGGVYEGMTPAAPILGAAPINVNATLGPASCTITPSGSPTVATSCLTPKRNPMIGGYAGFNIIGSEEGGWLYGAYKWGKDPIVSVGVADNYQSLAVRNFANNNLNDMNVFAGNVYVNWPIGGDKSEAVLEATWYKSSNGSNTANTGTGGHVMIGYRYGPIAVYGAGIYFTASDCDASNNQLTTAQLATCQLQGAGTPHAADTRELRAGLNWFWNKNLNHINFEFQENHGQSTYGPGAITNANAGYAPLALDPLVANGARRPFNANLRYPSFWSLLVHWNVLF
jgi:hypothetical protein